MMGKNQSSANIDLYFEMMIESEYTRTTSLRFLEQTTRTTSIVLLMTMLLLLLVLMMTMLLVLMIAIATRTSMLVSAANQKRDATSSSLKIEEVEEGRSCQPGWLSVGIEPGAYA